MSDALQDPGLWFLNTHVRIAVSADRNAGGISILEHHLPFDDASPTHVHAEEDEIIRILEGELRFRIGDRDAVAKAGDTLVAPHGIPHGFRVISAGGARFLTITRGGFEAMVRSASRPATEPGLPDFAEPTPETQAHLATLCRRQGIELLGPPIA